MFTLESDLYLIPKDQIPHGLDRVHLDSSVNAASDCGASISEWTASCLRTAMQQALAAGHRPDSEGDWGLNAGGVSADRGSANRGASVFSSLLSSFYFMVSLFKGLSFVLWKAVRLSRPFMEWTYCWIVRIVSCTETLAKSSMKQNTQWHCSLLKFAVRVL